MFYDAFGSPRRAVGTIQDITTLKNDEVKLFQYKHFFYESNDLNCIANVHGFFEKVNQKFSDLLGYSELDLVENSNYWFTCMVINPVGMVIYENNPIIKPEEPVEGA